MRIAYWIALIIVLVTLAFAIGVAIVAIALHTADGIEGFIEWAVEFSD